MLRCAPSSADRRVVRRAVPRACRARRHPNSPSPSTESRPLPQVCATSAASRGNGPVAGSTGTLARSANARAATLLPSVSITCGRRPDPDQSRIEHRARELGILGEKAVAGMHRIAVRLSRDAHQIIDVEIGLNRGFAFADQIRLVGFEAMQRETDLPAKRPQRCQYPVRSPRAARGWKFRRDWRRECAGCAGAESWITHVTKAGARIIAKGQTFVFARHCDPGGGPAATAQGLNKTAARTRPGATTRK